jgi:ATP-dependent exoDNAse (exonuclease V) alpha subunit
MTEMQQRAVSISLVEPKDWHKLDLYSSNQEEEIYQAWKKNGGLLLEGRAGTGKTRVIQHCYKRYLEDTPGSKILRSAFTNKASININGETLHQTLHIDSDGKIDIKYLEGYDAMIVDEISTIAGFMWNNIQTVKAKFPKMKFLLAGDYRQCPPIEDVMVDWFNSDLVRSIANNVQVELTERQRYDEALWDLAEDVYEKNKLTICAKKVPVNLYSRHQNICYLNETRDYVNKTSNDYMRGRHTGREIGDRYVYTGMPVIADATSKGVYANNESFVVTGLGESISLTSMRQGQPHIIKIDEAEFLAKFSMAYCITTHKLQGDTIDNQVYIWDRCRMSRNLLYTAVTRVRRMDQINIISGTPDLRA